MVGEHLILGIVLEAYCPLGNPGTPIRKGDDPSVLDDPVVKDIAEKNKATVGQVFLWNTPSQYNNSVDSKSTKSGWFFVCTSVI